MLRPCLVPRHSISVPLSPTPPIVRSWGWLLYQAVALMSADRLFPVCMPAWKLALKRSNPSLVRPEPGISALMPTMCLNIPSPAESHLEEGLRNTEAFRVEQGTGMLGWSRWVSLLCTFGWWKKCIVAFRFLTLIILNYFLCRLPISSSLIWFGGHLSCSFTCWVFLCLFILFRLLCLGWPFCILAVCGSSLLWRFLAVGGVDE